MSGMNAFLELFGNITVLDVILFIVAIAFVVTVSVQALRYLHKKMKEYDRKEKEWEDTVEATKKYPQYREQSMHIQEEFRHEIDHLKDMYDLMQKQLNATIEHLNKIDEQSRKREINKIRDLLLQYYKMYAKPETNPSHSWTEVESGTFWELFKDYEELGGDGLMHDVVEPAMRLLDVVPAQ